MEASWWERLTEGETGSCSDGPGHAQKIFNPIFCQWVELCSLPVIYLGPNYGGGNEDNGYLLQKVYERTAPLSAPGPVAGHCQCTPVPETPGYSWASLGQSLVGSLLLSPGSLCAQGSVCALQVFISPVLCKFWQLYGGVNGDLLQEGLCHTQVWYTQSAFPVAVHC